MPSSVLAKQRVHKLRDVYKRQIGFPLHLTGVSDVSLPGGDERNGMEEEADQPAGDGKEEAAAEPVPLPPRELSRRQRVPTLDMMNYVASQPGDDDEALLEEVMLITAQDQKKARRKRAASDDEDFEPSEDDPD
jgi:hypothetical protein